MSSLTGNSCGGDNCSEWLITECFMSQRCDMAVEEASVLDDIGYSSVGKQLCYLMCRSYLIDNSSWHPSSRKMNSERNVLWKEVLHFSAIFQSVLKSLFI